MNETIKGLTPESKTPKGMIGEQTAKVEILIPVLEGDLETKLQTFLEYFKNIQQMYKNGNYLTDEESEELNSAREDVCLAFRREFTSYNFQRITDIIIKCFGLDKPMITGDMDDDFYILGKIFEELYLKSPSLYTKFSLFLKEEEILPLHEDEVSHGFILGEEIYEGFHKFIILNILYNPCVRREEFIGMRRIETIYDSFREQRGSDPKKMREDFLKKHPRQIEE